MENEKVRTPVGTKEEIRKVLDEAYRRADMACKETKKQADIVYEEARKLAVDKLAKEKADKAHKEAVKQSEKVRDAIRNEALAVFVANYAQSDKDYQDDIIKSKERIELARKTYQEARKQADIIYKEAKKLAIDKQAKEEADKAYKEAKKKAEAEYNAAIAI